MNHSLFCDWKYHLKPFGQRHKAVGRNRVVGGRDQGGFDNVQIGADFFSGLLPLLQKKNVESVSMLIPPSQRFFLGHWGCLVRCETDFVPCLVNFDHNNAKEGRLKFDNLTY